MAKMKQSTVILSLIMRRAETNPDNKNYQDLYLGGVSLKSLTEDYDVCMSDLMVYLPATEKEMQSIEVNVHYLGYYLKWTPRRFITMQLNIRI